MLKSSAAQFEVINVFIACIIFDHAGYGMLYMLCMSM